MLKSLLTEVPTRLPVPAVPEIENAWGTREAAGWLGLVGVTGVRLSLQAVYWIPGNMDIMNCVLRPKEN